MYCSNCGRKDVSGNFCADCGAKVRLPLKESAQVTNASEPEESVQATVTPATVEPQPVTPAPVVQAPVVPVPPRVETAQELPTQNSEAENVEEAAAAKAPNVPKSLPRNGALASDDNTVARASGDRKNSKTKYEDTARLLTIVGFLVFPPVGIIGLFLSQKARKAGEKYTFAMVAGIICSLQTAYLIYYLTTL
jgi:hypothetical protein